QTGVTLRVRVGPRNDPRLPTGDAVGRAGGITVARVSSSSAGRIDMSCRRDQPRRMDSRLDFSRAGTLEFARCSGPTEVEPTPSPCARAISPSLINLRWGDGLSAGR